MTKKLNLDTMSVDEMWVLHEVISCMLSERLSSEKRELERRLDQLRGEKEARTADRLDPQPAKIVPRARRKYPRVFPKYRNPEEPSETWSGRGKKPRWLATALNSGHKIEEFAISGGESSMQEERARRE
jgi:DNA-binding protein H-NS